jgi:hypothetical protein
MKIEDVIATTWCFGWYLVVMIAGMLVYKGVL